MLRAEALMRTYVSGGRVISVLRDITFELATGAFLAITGPSGSGKSTLLGLLAGVAGEPTLNQPDGIHPTAEGHRRVAETVWQALKPIL